MSVYAYVNDDYAGKIATTFGMRGASDWVDTLKLPASSRLYQLRWKGHCFGLDQLRKEVAKYLQEQPPAEQGTRIVLEALLGVVQNRTDTDLLQISDT